MALENPDRDDFVRASYFRWSIARRVCTGAYRRGRQFLYSVRFHGIAFTLLRAAMFSLRMTKTPRFRAYVDGHFDRRYAVDTGGTVEFADLDVAAQTSEQCNDYEPTPPETIAAILSELPITFKDYVFLDLGAGKGLTLLIASLYGFQRIIGVEFSRRLCDVARENVRVFRGRKQRCRDIEVVCADARSFSFPPQRLVIYMFNAFKRDLMRRVLRNIAGSFKTHPRHIVVVYFNPLYADVLKDDDCLHMTQSGGETVAWHVYETQHAPGPPGHPHARRFGTSVSPRRGE